jgi:hypothetical protein
MVFAANADIAEALAPLRSDVKTLWAPSTVLARDHRGDVRVLTFGMAHKIQPDRYVQLKRILDSDCGDYLVCLSTAIHEGSSLGDQERAADALRDLFGPEKFEALGYLGDGVLAREIDLCDAVAIFYDPALRENNTSAWAVLNAGKPLITNRDSRSPNFVVADIDQIQHWRQVACLDGLKQGLNGWSALLETLRAA